MKGHKLKDFTSILDLKHQIIISNWQKSSNNEETLYLTYLFKMFGLRNYLWVKNITFLIVFASAKLIVPIKNKLKASILLT